MTLAKISLSCILKNLLPIAFKKYMLKEIKLPLNLVFNTHDPTGIKLLTKLRLDLSHLNKHRYKHNFGNCSNPKCLCISEDESTSFFFYNAIITIPYKWCYLVS